MADLNLIQPQSLAMESKTLPQPTEGTPEREPEVWDETLPAFNPHLAQPPQPYPVGVSPEFAAHNFSIDEYLAQEQSKDLFRFSTAGSVDDGKSTLIGRLLYDTQSVYDDQLRSIEGKGTTAPGVLDLALLTDGLRAEREQGITIDVAYRYFSTSRRKFIIADTPGHEQYTRNMATGASTADAAIILIDARKGVLLQSRRHAFVSALLGVHHIVLAVNKMDLVQYAQRVFDEIVTGFKAFVSAQNIAGIESVSLHFVPVSAIDGDNVVHPSSAMPWYNGATLLKLLETLPSSQPVPESPFRMAVQRVVRPNLDFRGFAGQIASGSIQCGDRITILPSGKSSRIRQIVTFDGNLQCASAPLSITLTLEDEVDISRGDIIAEPARDPAVASSLQATLVWMGSDPLDSSRRYVLKHMSRSVQCLVRQVHSVVDFGAGAVFLSGSALALNEIGRVSIEVLQPIPVDAYTENRRTGSFVLIDPLSNLTVAAGMIQSAEDGGTRALTTIKEAVTDEERQARYRHIGAHLGIGSAALLDALERTLFERGALVVRLSPGDDATARAATAAGILALSSIREEETVHISTLTGSDEIAVSKADVAQVLQTLLRELQARGVLLEAIT